MLSTSTDLLEVIFEKLSANQVHKVADAFGIELSCLPSVSDFLHDKKIEGIAMDGVVIADLHLRILCYSDAVYDVELNFVMKDVNAKSWRIAQERIHILAMRIARDYGIQEYYGGLEPAMDMDTRLFTKEKLGPWMLD